MRMAANTLPLLERGYAKSWLDRMEIPDSRTECISCMDTDLVLSFNGADFGGVLYKTRLMADITHCIPQAN